MNTDLSDPRMIDQLVSGWWTPSDGPAVRPTPVELAYAIAAVREALYGPQRTKTYNRTLST